MASPPNGHGVALLGGNRRPCCASGAAGCRGEGDFSMLEGKGAVKCRESMTPP
ncbi:MAG: hypothetical protein LBD24_04120 [Spirochaetaceae bacterium]|nr:hypothetical protein [Spirochaetaceae bacterium]